jgi:hypothetical protein
MNGIQTVMDLLIFTNDIVFNTFVSTFSIEAIVLVNSSDSRDYEPFVAPDKTKFKDNIRSLMSQDAYKISVSGTGNIGSEPNHYPWKRQIKLEGIVAADNSDLLLRSKL